MAEPAAAGEMDQLIEVVPEPAAAPPRPPQPEPEPARAPEPAPVTAPVAVPAPAAEPGPAAALAHEASPPQAPEAGASRTASHPRSVREMLARVDDGWRWFRAAAGAFPSERMDERLGEHGWTRKQMVAHVAAWHDLTADRLGRMLTSGKPAEFDQDTDAFNARIARQAVGRTAGELLKDMEMTFNRLRRRLAQLTDEHLSLNEGWAAHVIAGNTYDHYEEHRDDVASAAPDPRGRRR